jgi:cellulose synthase/poly-beta-1,6-N-acetylglucosamine synthase-like glycosyltransferase
MLSRVSILWLYVDSYATVINHFPEMQELVELECLDWANKKVNIKYEVRNNRKGYKAGALKKGMERIYAQQCDFVAIFDADFQPESDFLLKTIPFLVHNPKIALVQARWEFGKHKDIIFLVMCILYLFRNILFYSSYPR